MIAGISVVGLLAAVVVLLSYLIAYRGEVFAGSIVTPLKVWAGLGILTSVPYMVFLAIGAARPDAVVEANIAALDFDSLLLKFAVVQAAGVLALVVGYNADGASAVASARILPSTRIESRMEFPIALACLVLGAIVWALMLQQVGGVWFLLGNMESRAHILSGTGYLMQFGSSLLTIGALLGLCSVGHYPARLSVFLWVLVAVIVALALSVTGGRKSTIYLAISALFVWHYRVKAIEGFSVGLVLLGAVLAAYFLVVLSLRTVGDIGIVIQNPYVLWIAILDSLGWVVGNLSYVDTYLFVIGHFDKADFWYGAAYSDLLWSWVPSSLMQGKPPVDDGVYLRSLAEGMSVNPGAAAASLYPSSWPPETLGAGYMNFGIFGVVAFFLVLGFIFRVAAEFVRVQEYSFISIFVLANILLNFELTNLRIVQFVTALVVASGVLALATLASGPKKAQQFRRGP